MRPERHQHGRPLGRTTAYTYATDGRPETRTSPDGTVTTDSYDAETGQLEVGDLPDRRTERRSRRPTPTCPPASPAPGSCSPSPTRRARSPTATTPTGTARRSTYPDGSTTVRNVRRQRLAGQHHRRHRSGHDLLLQRRRLAELRHPDPRRHPVLLGHRLGSDQRRHDRGVGRLHLRRSRAGQDDRPRERPDDHQHLRAQPDARQPRRRRTRAASRSRQRTYDYDSHHNLVSKTETTAKPSSAR